MQNTYYTLGTLYQENNKIFKELKIDIDVITKTLREKITALRIEYWNLFINNFDKIKERLTKYSREQLFSSLRENIKLDFTASNCYALVIYAIENANKYFDSQIINIFEKLSSRENIRNYKSNQKVYEQDEWRYKQEKPTHYTLDKRIIYSGYCDGWNDKVVNDNNLLEDLITIANNLSFEMRWSSNTIYLGAANVGFPTWYSNKECAFSSIGDGLTDTDVSNLYTAVQTFQTSLSRNV